MGNNPILVLLCIFGILWFVFSLFFIVILNADLKHYKESNENWSTLYESLENDTEVLASLVAEGIQTDNRSLYIEAFRNNSCLQLIVCCYLKLQTENEKLKAHIEMLLTGRE